MTTTTIAYADCFSGISGDMFLAALLDAGLPEAELHGQLAHLGLALPKITRETVHDGALRATRLHVAPEANQPHRSWAMIRQIIADTHLDPNVQAKAQAIFAVLAHAEARVHGCPADEVHFHEIGGLDAIVDIVGVAIGLDYLGITRLVASPLPMPHGWVGCAHGSLPLPAPAVLEILHNVPVYGVDLAEELVTPTGAAILKSVATAFGPMPAMIMQKVGYGAGGRKRADGKPNILRLVIGEETTVGEAQSVQVIETNLDDWSPEGFPHLTEQLFALGALDVVLIPIQMKKGRPGFLLQVITEEARSLDLKRCILTETTAIGLRFRTEQRLTLPRTMITVSTPWGVLLAKRVETPAGPMVTPEYEECRRVAKEHNLPLRQVYAEVTGQGRIASEQQKGKS
jgi:uncharacterized protein (TIGR00299 family) protein